MKRLYQLSHKVLELIRRVWRNVYWLWSSTPTPQPKPALWYLQPVTKEADGSYTPAAHRSPYFTDRAQVFTLWPKGTVLQCLTPKSTIDGCELPRVLYRWEEHGVTCYAFVVREEITQHG